MRPANKSEPDLPQTPAGTGPFKVTAELIMHTAFSCTVNRGRTAFDYRREDLQPIPADAVFYVQKGKIKIVVASATA